MSNWLDTVADDYLTGVKSIVCSAYQISPVNTLAKLAGNAGFQPAQALTDAFNTQCGPPNAPTDNGWPDGVTFAVPTEIRVTNNAPADFSGGPPPGPSVKIITVTRFRTQPVLYFGSIPGQYFYTGDPGSEIQLDGGSLTSYSVFVNPSGPELQPPGAYPPLTTQQDTDLQQILDQLAAIRNTQGIELAGIGVAAAAATEAAAAATAGAAAAAAAAAAAEAALAAVEALTALVEAIQTALTALARVVGSGTGTDCDESAWNTLTAGVQDAIKAACLIISLTGLKDGPFSLTDGSQEQLDTLMDGFDALATRLDVGVDEDVTLCGIPGAVRTVRERFRDLKARIGYDFPVNGLNDPATGIPTPICTVADGLKNLSLLTGDVVIVQGFDAPVLRQSYLKLVWNEFGNNQQHSSMFIPAPVSGLTVESIAAASGPRTLGDYLCTLTYQTGRKLTAWFDTSANGESYLRAVAVLSNDYQGGEEFVYSYSPAKSPKKHLGADLLLVRGFLGEPSADGGHITEDFRF